MSYPQETWQREVATHLAPHGISLADLPDGALSAAYQNGHTPFAAAQWALALHERQVLGEPGNSAGVLPDRAVIDARALTPVTGEWKSVARTAKPVGPCATLLTIGLALVVGGNFLMGFPGTGMWSDGLIFVGALTSAAGLIVGLIGARRYFAQRDREYAAKHI